MQKSSLNLKADLVNRQYLAKKIKRSALIGLFAIVTFTLSGLNSSAQEVKEYGVTVALMKASSDVAVVNEALHIESLVYELNPYVIIREGIVSTYAEPPFVCVDSDAQSVDKLYYANPLYSQAELLTIRIDNQADLKIILDIAKLYGFTNLKYINFLCSIDCTVEQVRTILRINNSKITVLYLISIPS
jgi:hypothetical protein